MRTDELLAAIQANQATLQGLIAAHFSEPATAGVRAADNRPPVLEASGMHAGSWQPRAGAASGDGAGGTRGRSRRDAREIFPPRSRGGTRLTNTRNGVREDESRPLHADISPRAYSHLSDPKSTRSLSPLTALKEKMEAYINGNGEKSKAPKGPGETGSMPLNAADTVRMSATQGLFCQYRLLLV